MMIAKLAFGKTGHKSTRTLFGGAAIKAAFTQEQADKVLELLVEYGVNHIDTAASYGKGNSEARIGPWMGRYRDQFFLATKTGDRSYREAWESIHTSLKKLQVKYLDLIQMHNLTDPAEWEIALGPNGALKACVEAREQGLVRFIGVTGHGLIAPRMHMKSLERFPFDSVLLPWNYLLSKNVEYAAGFSRLTALCAERQIAVQAIKSIARKPWAGRERTATTWYEPLTGWEDISKAVSWLLIHEGIFLNTVGDATILPKVLEAASHPGPRPSDREMERMVAAQEMELIFTESDTIT
jgi:aryl-alcohol dehydrogenase-like predicted oxidoreductase